MKDLKTTLAGIIAGLPLAISAIITAYQAGQFTGQSGRQLAFSVGIILLGVFASDSKKETPTPTTEN